MSICRTHRKKNNFSILDNEAPNNENLSYQARGILWYLLTKPDGWQVKMKDIENRSKKNGRDGVRSAFKELMEEGYALRDRYHDETGKICWETHVFETKADRDEWLIENNLTIDAFPATVGHPRSADDGEPTHGDSGDGKASYIVNNDSSNTDQQNSEEIITDNQCAEEENDNRSQNETSNGFVDSLHPLGSDREAASRGESQSSIVKTHEYQVFLDVYNENKPDRWSKAEKLTPTRIKMLDRLIRDYGGKSLTMLQRALVGAKRSQFWSGLDYKFDYLYREKGSNGENGDKITGLAESVPEEDLYSDRVDLDQSGVEMMDDYKRMKAALAMFEQEAS